VLCHVSQKENSRPLMNFTKEQIKEIAEQLQGGMVCFWNAKDQDIRFLPNTDFIELEDEQPEWRAEILQIKSQIKDFFAIEPPASSAAYSFMEGFVATLPDQMPFKRYLYEILDGPKPFRNFKFALLRQGEFVDAWYKFEEDCFVQWVEDAIENQRFVEAASFIW
jgi:hypothetical protein